jgi:hypothetical protein
MFSRIIEKRKKQKINALIIDLEDIKLFKYLKSEISKDFFINWTKNRPPDKVRIQDICKYYTSHNIILVPGIIYAWKHPDKDYIEIYDGIHRLLAAYEQDYDMTFIISIHTTTNEKEIIDAFININKSVSIPYIYLDNTNEIKKTVCEKVAASLCKQYPKFVSSSNRPFIYNFNRDQFIEFISTLNIPFNKPDIDENILNILQELNKDAKQYVIDKKIKYHDKCSAYEFFLFYLPKHIIKNKLENNIVID